MSSTIVVGRGKYGSRRHFSAKHTIIFDIHGFERLLTKNQGYETSLVSCHGYKWSLCVYPWGYNSSEEVTSFYLQCRRTSSQQSLPTAKYTVCVGDLNFESEYTWTSEGYAGQQKFAKRSDLLSRLDSHGTLVLHVGMSLMVEKEPVWHPTTTLQEKLELLLMDDKYADVTFVFPGGDLVHAHKLVLQIQSPTLIEFVQEAEDGKVIIDQADPDLFATMIRFLYSNSLPSTFDLKEDGLKLLELANTFGCVDLKMVLEAKIVESDLITVENAVEMLLTADGNSAALLKEAALDCVLTNPTESMQSEGWKDMQKSNGLLEEAIVALAGIRTKQGQPRADQEYLEVSALRKCLANQGMDFDGTKEMLVKRLKAANGNDS